MLATQTMNRMIRLFVIAVICISFISASCARQPTHERSASIIKSYLKKYGKKYPDTAFGKQKVSNIEIVSQGEVHKHLVAVEAFLTFADGSVQRIHATIVKGPLGWKFVSWENAS